MELITLRQLKETICNSDRIMIVSAAGNVVYRGYAANMEHQINMDRKAKKISMGLETYRKTDKMWDWSRIDNLPEQIPFESIPQYDIGELTQILYIKIQLKSDFE